MNPSSLHLSWGSRYPPISIPSLVLPSHSFLTLAHFTFAFRVGPGAICGRTLGTFSSSTLLLAVVARWKENGDGAYSRGGEWQWRIQW
jgi:integral membrane sensor domain MASE1